MNGCDLNPVGRYSSCPKGCMGGGVGNIEVLGRYPDFATGSKAAVAIAADPDSIALLAEREKI